MQLNGEKSKASSFVEFIRVDDARKVKSSQFLPMAVRLISFSALMDHT